MEKNSLRKEIRDKRRALSDSEREQAAFALAENIISSKVFKQSRHIAFYLANDGEMNLDAVIQFAWKQGKKCYLPVLAQPNTNKLWFIPFTPSSKLYLNRFGIAEPEHFNSIRARKTLSLDLIMMPLVAFDLHGNRLGMGGGFYDRTLAFLRHRKAWHKPELLGIAYEFQKQQHIKASSWDVPVTSIATEEKIYRF